MTRRNIHRDIKHQWMVLTLLVLIGSCLFSSNQSVAQETLSKNESQALLSLIETAQQPWEKYEVSGKLKMDGLPVSPSLKIYMENGVRIDISIRAPFLGEIGRIQADKDSILAINKMKKCYWSAPTDEVSARYPGGLELIQSALLGRIYIFGEGPADTGMRSHLNIYSDDEGWLLMPKPKYQPVGAKYGYVISASGLADALVVERTDSEDFLQIDYLWKSKGKREVNPLISFSGKNIEASLQFDAPSDTPSPMSPIKLDTKYQRVELREFFKKLY